MCSYYQCYKQLCDDTDNLDMRCCNTLYETQNINHLGLTDSQPTICYRISELPDLVIKAEVYIVSHALRPPESALVDWWAVRVQHHVDKFLT